ncbi:HTH-type transcriptional activator IlvY [Alteromonas oceanisediminis]|uniref:HTH-type transcriptional activator IlvY n=1 Tax=Alteromonas oceanisediminis TaxID=2836180 RepID=UPI001BDA370A|nr:HTH-type transcriptional activator IlvY [Alteromonas oceanisediminis]MBT0586210.1 HTH-type transcriptional activator IlvY [Alteromonas oceanisediminis]
MDLKELSLFCHLANSLHFGKTASAKFVSPSTLSRVITRLESEVGATLFWRNNRQVALTKAGEKLLAFALPVLEDWVRLKSQLNIDGQQLSGKLTLFCSVTASQSHLPLLLDKFRQQHSLVDIKLETGDPGIAVKKVIDGVCDVSIAINSPDFPAALHFAHLAYVPLVLVAPKSMRVSALADVQWSQTQVVMPDSGPTRRTVHHWFAEAGIRPTIYASVGGNEAIVSMVALGCGVGFVPKVVVEHSTLQHHINVIEVDNIESYELGLCCLSSRRNDALIHALFQQLES